MAVRMEDLRYQSWSLGRQLNSMYEMIEKMCGGGVQVTAKRESQPISVNKDDVDHQQMLLDGLRRQDRLLREQIQDLIAKLPVRGPQNTEDIQAASNGQSSTVVAAAPAAEALRHFLVSNGGETGGWDAKDHGLFLQWRSRFRNNRQTFVSAVCDTAPGKNAAQVEAHEKWYQNLQRLRKEQREELDAWKRRKKCLDEEDRKKAVEEAQRDPIKGDPWVAEWRRQRATVRQQLNRWKEEKAKAAEPVVTDEMIDAETRKSQAEQKRRMDQQYQKLIAYLWRMEQEAAKMAAESADHFLARLARKEKSQSNAQLRAEQRRERDREWLEQRRRQLLTRQQQQQPPKVLALRRSVSVPRDPQRLLRPTSAFIARLLPDDEQFPSSKPKNEFYVLDIQSKTVPSWRQLSTE